MIDIRLPNITATDTEGKMSQMQSYMHQLVEQLNWALSTVDNAIQGNTSNVVVASQNGSNSEEEAVNTFNSIKALIIKSADIVKAYEESMKTEFNGEYIAVSDFGTYLSQTNKTVEDNSRYAVENFANVQTVTAQGKTLAWLENETRTTEAYIKRGHLDDDENGNAIYGVEVGQSENGGFKRFSRFTAGRLSFYDGDSNEVAYISKNKLYVRDATFLGTVLFRNYKADTSDGLAFTWLEG